MGNESQFKRSKTCLLRDNPLRSARKNPGNRMFTMKSGLKTPHNLLDREICIHAVLRRPVILARDVWQRCDKETSDDERLDTRGVYLFFECLH
jgi:hypothetical protein